jgi:hypothetical protein
LQKMILKKNKETGGRKSKKKKNVDDDRKFILNCSLIVVSPLHSYSRFVTKPVRRSTSYVYCLIYSASSGNGPAITFLIKDS